MINELTKEQEALFPTYVERFTKLGLATGRCDRVKVENSIYECYDAGNLPHPERIIWCDSPLSMVITYTVLKNWDSVKAGVRDSVRASVRDSFGGSVRDSVWGIVGSSVRDSAWASVGSSVSSSVRGNVKASVLDNVWASVAGNVGDSVRVSVKNSVGDSFRDSTYGQHDAGWLSFYSFFHEQGLADLSQINGLVGMLQAGWWLPCENICLVSERPKELSLDNNDQLHCPNGMAFKYFDGWGDYFWHGTRVPKEWIEDGIDDPLIALNWENTEQRYAAAEIMGWEKIIDKLNPRIIDTDKNPMIGTLLEVDLPGLGRERFLQYQCGTGRLMASPVVDKNVKTALEANAQFWGSSGIDPKLLRQEGVRT